MKATVGAALAAIVLPLALAGSVGDPIRYAIVGDAILEGGAYAFLETISDRFGPRMIGTDGHRRSLDYLEAELQALGLETERQRFLFPGWKRGGARLRVVAPIERTLRAVELGYVSAWREVYGSIHFVGTKDAEAVLAEELSGHVLLFEQNLTFPQSDLERFVEAGAVAALLINRVDGGQLLARVANHHGEPPPFPMLSITQEEGLWLKRLAAGGQTVELRIETGGETVEMEGTNLIARLPGASGETVALGGHFDSWDLGQGAIDNGLGVAQLYETARLLSRHSPANRHAVELVWFDAEEFGLWGSKFYAAQMDRDRVRVMINLDMVGRPIALNAMGFDGLVEPLEAFSRSLGSWRFEKPVANKTWLGSDHHPFILEGVPAITFNAPLDHEDARYYHDFADTFDKVDREMLGRASALVALLTHRFANDDSVKLERLDGTEVEKLFRKAGAEERMKRSGLWPFGDE